MSPGQADTDSAGYSLTELDRGVESSEGSIRDSIV